MVNIIKMIKRKISEISKKGFTLVELLAVIVILAIIMLIAIPAVLNTLQTARKKAFSEYVDKIVTLAEQKDLSNELLQTNSSSECTVYDITKDLELSSTGDYKGYILVKKDSQKAAFLTSSSCFSKRRKSNILSKTVWLCF